MREKESRETWKEEEKKKKGEKFATEQLGILKEGHAFPPFLVFREFCMCFDDFHPPCPSSPQIHSPSIPTKLCILSQALSRPICSVQTFLDG